MNKTFLLIIIALVLGLIFPWARQRQSNAVLQTEMHSLQTQIKDLAGQVTSLRQMRQRTAPPQTIPVESPETGAELSRLRNEVDELHSRLAELGRHTASLSNQLAAARGENIPFVYADSTKRKDYAPAGYTTPQSAFQTLLWSISKLDARTFQASLTGGIAETFAPDFKELPEGVMHGGFRNGAMYKASGFRVLEETPISADETRLKVFLEGARTTVQPVFKRVNGEWKWSSNQ